MTAKPSASGRLLPGQGPHRGACRVAADEVEQVANTRLSWWCPAREGTAYLFGTTNAGRSLLVVLTEALEGGDYVVTAPEMTSAERQNFRRQEGEPMTKLERSSRTPSGTTLR